MEDIRDIKGFVPVPHSWWWLWLLILLLVLGLVFVWWRKRQRPATVAGPVSPATPAELALAALQKLRSENPPVEEFYTRLSGIVRRYIEDRFGLHAPERTTEEFLAEASLAPGQMALLGAFLQESDLVKFARHRPGQDDRERAAAAGEKFIREST
jgi:hypothetical protein